MNPGSIVRAVIPLLLLAGLYSPLGSNTLTYREVEGDIVTTHVLTFTPEESGFLGDLCTRRPGGDVFQTLRVDADLATLAWTFSDPGRRMDLAARVQGQDIVLTGSLAGKRVDRRFSAKGPPWNQLFQVGLGPFALSGEKSMAFRSIGTQGPGELKIGKMSVTRKGEETIEIAGKPVAAIQLRISLSGLLSVFWHGDYWYRRSDGLFLRYRGRNRKGGPIAVSELIEEKP